MAALPVRRALLDRPQPLGFLPTLWFWNDRERQRLMVPLIVTIAVPLGVSFFFLMAWLDLPVWLFLVFGTVWPHIVLGLVERRVRRVLEQRALGGPETMPAPAPPAPAKVGEHVTLALAGFGACGTLVAVGAAWGAGPAVATGLALALLAAIASARFLKRERATPRCLASKPGQLPSPPELRR